MITTLILATILTLPQERTVAVILGPEQTVTMTVAEAERQLRVTDDPILRHALVVALGSIGEGDSEPRLTRQERERFRWHRRSTQRK